jgi:hypothetical protein
VNGCEQRHSGNDGHGVQGKIGRLPVLTVPECDRPYRHDADCLEIGGLQPNINSLVPFVL